MTWRYFVFVQSVFVFVGQTRTAACAAAVVAAQPAMEAHDRLQMHAALMSFATAVHRERLDYVDGVLSSCAEALGAGAGGATAADADASGEDGAAAAAAGEDGAPASPAAAARPAMIISDQKGVRQLVALLTVPLDTYDVVGACTSPIQLTRSSKPPGFINPCVPIK
jgi:vacuolar protein sorting-associated protein 35